MAEMSPLRRRMIEDMTVRNLSPATQRSTFMRLRSSVDILAARRTFWGWRRSVPFRFIWSRPAFDGRPLTRRSARCGSSMA
jgi:hypothetical protein